MAITTDFDTGRSAAIMLEGVARLDIDHVTTPLSYPRGKKKKAM